jgi:outer membrane protein assembly factor BamB
MLNRLASGLLVCTTGFAGDVLAYHNDNARTGWNRTETILTPANVGVNTSGRLFDLSVGGRVDAEPLYAGSVNFASGTHNALYGVTESGSVYAFDADNGAKVWSISTLEAGEAPSDARNCGPRSGDNSSGGSVVFDPKQYKERASLLLLNGIPYTSWVPLRHPTLNPAG